MPRCDEQYVSRSPAPRSSFVPRELRYSDSSLPLRVVEEVHVPGLEHLLLGAAGQAASFSVFVGQPSPNDSSMKLAILPSQLNVAECQKSTFVWS